MHVAANRNPTELLRHSPNALTGLRPGTLHTGDGGGTARFGISHRMRKNLENVRSR